MKKHRIFLSPLDWGLGHAGRSCYLVQQLLEQNFDVMVAANQQGLELFHEHFHDKISYIEGLPNYNIHYQGKSLALSLARQFSSIKSVIREEQEWIKLNAGKLELSGIISDNRFGLYHNSIPSVYLTHQLTIKAYGFEKITRMLHQRVIRNFTECWIPDSESNPLAPDLSKPIGNLDHYKYISWLNRLELVDELPYGEEIDVLVIASGPEPHRSKFIQLCYNALSEIPGKHLILGAKAKTSPQGKNENISYLHHADAAQFKGLVKVAKHVLCRPGYTSLMELGKFEKSMILVPSKGQTEQEYLAKKLANENVCTQLKERNLYSIKLSKALLQTNRFILRQEEVNWQGLFQLFKTV